LSFEQGALLRVYPGSGSAGSNIPVKDGWTWGSMTTNATSTDEVFGWFPTGYAVLTSAPPPSKPTLPWINEQQQQGYDTRHDQENEGTFQGQILGGTSPALDYSALSPENPFVRNNALTMQTLEQMKDNDRITILPDTKPRKERRKLLFGQGLSQKWRKVEQRIMPHHRRISATTDDQESEYIPSISVTPSSSTTKTSY
jgi:hypothetical protein